jgi:hypothetical protein
MTIEMELDTQETRDASSKGMTNQNQAEITVINQGLVDDAHCFLILKQIDSQVSHALVSHSTAEFD